MTKYHFLAGCMVLIFLSGCASFSKRQSLINPEADRDPLVQFSSKAHVGEVRRGDQQIQFLEESLSLNGSDLLLMSGTSKLKEPSNQRRIPISKIESVALYPGNVTHPNQLQLKYKKDLVLIQVLGMNRTNDDARTQRLYDMLISNGVSRGRTDQFYYVGMDLSKPDKSAESQGSFFTAAAGARLGEFIWDSVKVLGSLAMKAAKFY